MRPENRALLTVVLTVVLVTSVVGAYLLLTPSAPPTFLPVPVGTVFTANATMTWAAHFSVGAVGGTLVGAWTAYDGWGFLNLVVVNGTVPKPPPWRGMLCPLIHSWAELNGTVDQALAPGFYTAYWSTGYCSSASQIVVTQGIQVMTL